jgi:hypothetical protein
MMHTLAPNSSPPPRRFIKDDYLQQNSFTKYDRYCPFYKSVEMMRNIATFHRLATAAVERTAGGNAEVRVAGKSWVGAGGLCSCLCGWRKLGGGLGALKLSRCSLTGGVG